MSLTLTLSTGRLYLLLAINRATLTFKVSGTRFGHSIRSLQSLTLTHNLGWFVVSLIHTSMKAGYQIAA